MSVLTNGERAGEASETVALLRLICSRRVAELLTLNAFKLTPQLDDPVLLLAARIQTHTKSF